MRTPFIAILYLLLAYGAYGQQNNCQLYTDLLPQLEAAEGNLMYSLNYNEQSQQSNYFKQLSKNAVSYLEACNNTIHPRQVQKKLTNYYLLGKHAEDGELFLQAENYYMTCIQDNRSRDLYYEGQPIYQLALNGLNRVENASPNYVINNQPVYRNRTGVQTTQPYQSQNQGGTFYDQARQQTVSNQYNYQAPQTRVVRPTQQQNTRNYYNPYTGQYNNSYTNTNNNYNSGYTTNRQVETVSHPYNAPHPSTHVQNRNNYVQTTNRNIVVQPPRQRLVSNTYNNSYTYNPISTYQQPMSNVSTNVNTRAAYISSTGVIGRISPITDSYPEIYQTNNSGYQIIVQGNLNAVKSMTCSLPGVIFNPAVISSSDRRNKFVLNINRNSNHRDIPVTVTLQMMDNTTKTYSYVLR